MGKKKAPGQNEVKLPPQFWCYYCDMRHEDEYKLIQHQRSKHFLCRYCDPNAYGRNCLSLSGLVSHVRRSHRKEVKEVPNAIEGRTSLDVEVSAMQNIPIDALNEFKAKLAEEMQAAQAEGAAAEIDTSKFSAAELRQMAEADGTAPPPDEAPYPSEPAQPTRPAQPARPVTAASPTQAHTPMMPHLADLANRLASQLSEHASAAVSGNHLLAAAQPPPEEEVTKPPPEAPAAFDPAMLASRIAAAKLAEEEEEAKMAYVRRCIDEEEEREARREKEAARRASGRGDRGGRGDRDRGDRDRRRDPLPRTEKEDLDRRVDNAIAAATGAPLPDEGRPRDRALEARLDDDRRREERKRARSRSRKETAKVPSRGSLKFRPRSMNRSQEREMVNATRRENQLALREESRADTDRRTREGREEVREDIAREEKGRNRDYEGRADDDGRGRGEESGRRRRRDEDVEEERPQRRRRRDEEPEETTLAIKTEPAEKRRSKWDTATAEEQVSTPAMSMMMSQQDPGVQTKSEICMSFTEGLCTKGALCPYAHYLRELAPGGYKPKLCPSFLRGGCPRQSVCLFAHTKEELPPNFKCIMCHNFQQGFCRKQQICPFAHAPEEQQWFVTFMTGAEDPNEKQWDNRPHVKKSIAADIVVGADGHVNNAAIAANVLAAAESQLATGKSLPGQLAIGNASFPQLAKAKPAFQPRINVTGNPALVAAKAAALAKMAEFKAKAMGLIASGSFKAKAGGLLPGAMGSSPPGLTVMGATFAKASPGMSPPSMFPPSMSPPGMSPPQMSPPFVPTQSAGIESKAFAKALVGPSALPQNGGIAAGAPAKKPCVMFEMGCCVRGESCPFLHTASAP